jgi:hypothetical protein
MTYRAVIMGLAALVVTGCQLHPLSLSPKAAIPEIILARKGSAMMPVVIATNASERVKAAAEDLARYLGRIGSAQFAVQLGEGTSGIAVGTASDFPALNLAHDLAIRGIGDRETYILRSHRAGLHVVGATDIAVEDAVWDLLQRLGYRQFFPGKTWEVVPRLEKIALAIDATERPDYYARRIWYGYGAWDYAKQPYAEWCLRNRARSGFDLNTGHAYDHLIRQNKAAFDAHPEFYGLAKGQRKSTKICIGNPDLRQLICDYAVREFDADPGLDSISMDPSDGGGWCECERCAALGSISDRALTLANQAAEAIARKHPNKYVGMYAYAFHSPPPRIRVHSNVVISVACGFIKGGYTVEELISGWQKQGATLGIREYYSVNTWDRDMPGRARGGKLDYLARTIPDFHAEGARFLSAESSDNWGPNGLGYYIAARLLWDVAVTGRVAELVDDFLARAFGPAKAPMAEFYKLLDGGQPWLVFDDQIGRMYRQLAEAAKLADTPEIKARIHDLVLYARYVELFQSYTDAEGPARQQAFENLIRHTYRMRCTMMVHTLALYRDLAARDKQVSIPPDATWNVPEGRNPWKSSEPFAAAELARFVSDGIAKHPLTDLGFEAVRYSDDWVPATPLHLPDLAGDATLTSRGKQEFAVWVTNAPGVIELRVTGGLIAHYRDRGNVKLDLWQLGGASETGDRETLVAHDESAPPDGTEHVVRLPAKQTGLHLIRLADGHDMTSVSWTEGTPMTIRASLDAPPNIHGRWTLCFYVPQATRVIGLYADGEGELLDPAGKVAFTFPAKARNYYRIPVPAGQDGKLWRFRNSAGTRRLMTVPPCLARNNRELLLPREVVVKDAPHER